VPFPQLTPTIAADALTLAGVRVAPEAVAVEARGERWMVRLPDQRLAWFAASESGRRRLVTERRVLRLLEARCRFGAPRILLEGGDGDLDVRTIVPGDADPWDLYAAMRDGTDPPTRVGVAVGRILAEQHTKIHAADVEGWLRRRPEWPEPRSWIRERLVHVVDDTKLTDSADAVMAAYEAVPLPEADRVLVHTDVGFHNVAIDAASRVVHGLFDYDSAAWADRHHDFRYLVFDMDGDEMLDAARSIYEPLVGCTIDRQRVLLYNAACALSFLAYRAGTSPEERSCGRTLAEDLRWSRHAIGRALGA
jgi:aminoglycoside phosphotransferase (APT) family kinase protein